MVLIGSLSKAYLTRQAKQIAEYGERKVTRFGVSEEILDAITPFRRTSAKPTSLLSDAKWYIDDFEKNVGSNFLPPEWNTFSEAQKIDYIVKDRYSRLVSHRAMDYVKDKPVEHLVSLNADGDIIGFSSGIEDGVGKEVLEGTKTTVHNHPKLLEDVEAEAIGNPHMLHPTSSGDIIASVSNGIRSYVVDSYGNKFLFDPPYTIPVKGTRAQAATRMGLKLDLESGATFGAYEELNRKLDNINTLEEFARTKAEGLNEILTKHINAIKDFAKKGWCKFDIVEGK